MMNEDKFLESLKSAFKNLHDDLPTSSCLSESKIVTAFENLSVNEQRHLVSCQLCFAKFKEQRIGKSGIELAENSDPDKSIQQLLKHYDKDVLMNKIKGFFKDHLTSEIPGLLLFQKASSRIKPKSKSFAKLELINLSDISFSEDQLEMSLPDMMHMTVQGFPTELENHTVNLIVLPLAILENLYPDISLDMKIQQLENDFTMEKFHRFDISKMYINQAVLGVRDDTGLCEWSMPPLLPMALMNKHNISLILVT